MEICSLELEKHVIAGLLKYPNVYGDIAGFIDENDFHGNEINKVVFCVVRQCLNAGEPTDKVILGQKIKNMGISFEVDINIFDYLDSLSLIQINENAVLKSCQELKKFTIARRISDSGKELAAEMKRAINKTPQEIISLADKIYNKNISVYTENNQPIDLFDDIEENVEKAGNNPVEEHGLMSPYPTFNRYFGGLRDGNVYSWVSRPGAGKTTIATDICVKSTVLNPGVKSLMLDTEMERVDISMRACSAISGVPLWYLETGNWRKNEEMVKKVRDAWPKVKQLKGNVSHMYVAGKPIEEVCSIIRRWYYSKVGRGNRALVSYDYLKLTGEKMTKEKQEYHIIGEKTDMLKQLSSELHFPLLTFCQLNRSAEQGIDDSSAISQSDRIQWFSSFVGLFRRKTLEEIAGDTEHFGTHKLIPLKTRFQGKESAGHHDLVRVEVPQKDGSTKVTYKANYVNFQVENFNVEDRGSLRDMINRSRDDFNIANPSDNDVSL